MTGKLSGSAAEITLQFPFTQESFYSFLRCSHLIGHNFGGTGSHLYGDYIASWERNSQSKIVFLQEANTYSDGCAWDPILYLYE